MAFSFGQKLEHIVLELMSTSDTQCNMIHPIIVIIIIIIIIISFMQGIHTHIHETNHVPRGYTVAAILSLLFMVPLFLVPALALLFFYVSIIIITVIYCN